MASESPRPLGFPHCGGVPDQQPKQECAYLRTGPLNVCLACARSAITSLGPSLCQTCAQTIDASGCRNRLCRLAPPDRAIDRIHAIGEFSGELQTAIHRYKYGQRHGWRIIFGRLVTGWLNDYAWPGYFDLVVPNPTSPPADPPTSLARHTARVLEAAESEDQLGTHNFDCGNLSKAVATPKSAGLSWDGKRDAARAHAAAISAADPSRFGGRHVLVYDDVCTTGLQLDGVARVLKDHYGAARVEGLVLARAPWR